MMVLNGADRKHHAGYAGLAAILVLTGLVTAAVLIGPSLVQKGALQKRSSEDQTLERLGETLHTSIRTTQYIPGATNWASTLASFSGLNQTAVEQVYPEFASDSTTRRVFLIDPSLGSTALPYLQNATGLLGSLTNLAGSGARVMLISNTKRGLSLPVSTGLATSSASFNAIWNWTFNPSTKSPPSGWSSSWNGYGDELHVARINLANLFHTVSLKTVLYELGNGWVTLPASALAPTSFTLLDGTLLKIYETNGTFYEARRVTADTKYEFTITNAAQPVIYYKLSELIGSIATNSGSYGSSWNGVFTNGVTLGVKEPVPPAFPSFPTNNSSAYFDGIKSYIETCKRLTNVLPAFTLAAWIWPEQNSKSITYFAGIRGSLNLNWYMNKSGANLIRISTAKGSSLAKTYPYPLKAWHHVAAVGTGSQLQLYVDGKLLGYKSYYTANYYSSNAYTFRIGANPQISKGAIKWTSPQYNGGIDEVVFYDRALGSNEVAKLATGVIP